MTAQEHESQFPPRPTALAREILREWIRPGDTVIDATAGNGHDTLFLAERCGPDGRVLAFDVQKQAIEASHQRVAVAGCAEWVEFHHCSHVRIGDFTKPASISAVMFNLGYLPGNDHHRTTTAEETLMALDASAIALKSRGVLTIICYPGHEAGAVEADAVEAYLTAKSASGWRTAKYAILGTLRPAPFLLVASNG
jgi:predicted methyltransferase